VEQLDIEIGMVANPEAEAIAQLRAHQEAAGITFDNPDEPVTPSEATLYGEEDMRWST